MHAPLTRVVLGVLLGASVMAASPPGLENARHLPAQPKTGEEVVVSFRPKAETEVKTATVQIQVVEPGQYIRRNDPQFESNWRDFPMRDDGQAGDAKAADGVFSATIPGSVQKHRRLIRYRFTFETRDGKANEFPVRTNACPNLAWFVYDQLPAWKGASRPGSTPLLEFSPDFLNTLPAYHLIAKAEDVAKSQWDGSFNRQPFFGSLVYDGHAYDHIAFHNRGQASTYVAGKNKWGFKFNPGHEFAARNFWGEPYNHKWGSLNLNPCASAWAQVNRGMAGMDEAVAYRAYHLAGVPASDTFWIQFRVIDAPEEISPRDQYEGDLWGLYLVVQEKNGTWLRENGLPDGNIYNLESGPKHLAPGMPADNSDLNSHITMLHRPQTESWWRATVDLPAYYSFHALNRLLANIDLRPDGNHYLYHKPDNHWVVLPHDLDMMFIPKQHQPGFVRQIHSLDLPALKIEYQNRAREILDLFCSDSSTNGGQVGQLVAELSRALRPAGQERTWAELDQAMWNWHPQSNARGQFYVTPQSDHRMGGGWRRTLPTPDLAGFCKYIVDFCTDSRPQKNYRPNDGNQLGYGFGFLAFESADPNIPDRPAIRYSGPPGFSSESLSFSVSPFSSPSAQKAAAVEWRIARISAPGVKGFTAGQHWKYEIEPGWSSGELTNLSERFAPPANACAPGHTCRIRARYKDQTGRWSHWSEAIQFVPLK